MHSITFIAVDETTLNEEDLRETKRRRKINFAIGCFLAFTSGVTSTVNTFIVKATGIDFGEIVAVRGILQTLVMFLIIAYEGKYVFDWFTGLSRLKRLSVLAAREAF